MALGRQGDRQGDLVVSWREMPRSPGHVFYDRLQAVLIDAGFDTFAETACKPYYAAKMGAPSIPPGRYFRMHMVGYFEGIDSERGIEWRCADSLSLRDFLRLETTARVPDHSWLSKTRSRLPHEVHEAVFGWVLSLIAERGLVKSDRIGVDASTMEANAALLDFPPDPGATLLGVPRMLVDERYRARGVRHIQNPKVRSFFTDELPQWDKRYLADATAALGNVIETFLTSPVLRNIFGQPKSSFSMRQLIDRGGILVVSLSKGLLGEQTSNIIGSFIVSGLQAAAMSRADTRNMAKKAKAHEERLRAETEMMRAAVERERARGSYERHGGPRT